MTKTCTNYPWQALHLTFPPKQSFFIINKVLLKPYFGSQWNVSTFCILAERGRPGRSNQENCLCLNVLIGNFPTLHYSRRDNETCWLLDVRSLTNPPDSVIVSPNKKGSVILQKSRIGRVDLVNEDSANVSKGRTNVNIQSTPVEWTVRKGGALPAKHGLTNHLLGLRTRVLACPICSIDKCTFVWHNCSP